jgi:alpha-amylase/alpha-mannosidase (GH57 family)
MSADPRSVVVHAHFYQPPREDPWLEEVPVEPGAAPYHDWNARIEQECYRAVVAARVPGAEGRIARIVNTLAAVSFDVGPTLLDWHEEAAPSTYRAMLDADRASAATHDGHGNAIAAPLHHVILPLSPRRDKETEVRWGIADFRRRFGRVPEGMWLPETAVDDETLDVLAAEGIKFTVLAPRQVVAPPPHGLPGRYRTSAGRSIALFVYDGAVSHDVAFGPFIRDAVAWVDAVAGRADDALVAVATDGETFGHHHRFGELALAAFLDGVTRRPGLATDNFAAFLARHPAAHDVVLKAPSSWSCTHGVERWRSDCGCRMHPERGWQQRWRAPLREALDALAAELHAVFAAEGAPLLHDVWTARDAYGDVLVGARPIDAFLAEHAQVTDAAGRRRAVELLEMERHALGMFTSCGWFFDDVGGIETRQILRYAARAMELAGTGAPALEAALRERLASAPGNDPAIGSGRDVYDRFARPTTPPAARIAAGVAAARAANADPESVVPLGFLADLREDGVVVRQRRTGRTDTFRARVERPRPGRLHVAVTAAGGADTWEITPDGLPERAREVVTGALMRDIRDLWFSETEDAALCRGVPLLEVATGALLRAVVGLAEDRSSMATAQVLDLLDLFALLDAPVPFDVQTAFHAIRQRLDPAEASVLAPLAPPLGFV